ncbi:MAG: rod shape-determining protein RodA [bacterium]|nr:rod shape-determining protein RodA [bacterium]
MAKSHLRRLDWKLAGAAVALSLIGLLSLYSSSLTGGDFASLQKQIGFLFVGIFLMLGFSLLDWRVLKNDPYFILLLYVLGVVALIGVLLFAPEIRGVRGWYRVFGLSVDPREFLKIVLVLLMAKYFSARHIELYRIRHILLSAFYFLVPMVLIFLQPDLGVTMLLGVLWLTTLLVSGIRLRHFLALIFVGLIAASLGWGFLLHDYQKDRIMGFVAPEVDPLGIGWSQQQSKIAIGSGGLLGKGIGEGTQTQYGFLSEPKTDFIFAAIAEEFGLAGVLAVFVLFIVLVLQILRIGIEAKNNFARLVSAGMATLFIAEFGINVGMNLGLLPIIGLPLPFVSYGGSALLMNFVGLGILQSIQTH